MIVPLLRIMTEKSIIGFGQYKDMKIGDIIKLGKNDYLRWIYYNYEGLSFTDEILYKINIRGRWKISKPGKDIDSGIHLEKIMLGCRIAKEKGAFLMGRYKKRAKVKLKRFEKQDNRYWSKEKMQQINQGNWR